MTMQHKLIRREPQVAITTDVYTEEDMKDAEIEEMVALPTYWMSNIILTVPKPI